MQTSATPTQEPSRRPRHAKTWLAGWLFWAFATGLLFAGIIETVFGSHLGHIPGFGCGNPRSLSALAQYWDGLFSALLLVSGACHLPLHAVLGRQRPATRSTNVISGAVAGAIGGMLMAAPLARSVALMEWYWPLRAFVDFGGCRQLYVDWQSLFAFGLPDPGIDMPGMNTEVSARAVIVAVAAVIVGSLCGGVAAWWCGRPLMSGSRRLRAVALIDSPFAVARRWSLMFLVLPALIGLVDLVLQLGSPRLGGLVETIRGPLGVVVLAVILVGQSFGFAAIAAIVGSAMVSNTTWRAVTPLPASWEWGHAIVGAFAMAAMVINKVRVAPEVMRTVGEMSPSRPSIDLRVWLIGALLGLAWGGASAHILRRHLSSHDRQFAPTQD